MTIFETAGTTGIGIDDPPFLPDQGNGFEPDPPKRGRRSVADRTRLIMLAALVALSLLSLTLAYLTRSTNGDEGSLEDRPQIAAAQLPDTGGEPGAGQVATADAGSDSSVAANEGGRSSGQVGPETNGAEQPSDSSRLEPETSPSTGDVASPNTGDAEDRNEAGTATTTASSAPGGSVASSTPPGTTATSTVPSSSLPPTSSTTAPSSTTTSTTTSTSISALAAGTEWTLGGGGSSSQSVLPLSEQPSGGRLPNYDSNRNDDPGLTLQKGDDLDERDSTKMQRWWNELPDTTRIAGTPTLTVFAATKDFDTGKTGRLVAGLYDCSPSLDDCRRLASGAASFRQSSFGSDFGEVTITMSPVDATVAAGRGLMVKMAVPGNSDDDLWLAYGTRAYPTSLTFE